MYAETKWYGTYVEQYRRLILNKADRLRMDNLRRIDVSVSG